MDILVVDVGGTHVKVRATNHASLIEIYSGPTMTPRKVVSEVKKLTARLKYDAITIGYPGPAIHGKIVAEPHNLGDGWINFNFPKAFGYPVKIVNDAAMQALGSYRGKRMLFLGLVTGLGTAMIIDGVLAAMELAHLPYKNGKTYEDYVGLAGLQRLEKTLAKAGQRCRSATQIDSNHKHARSNPVVSNKSKQASGYRTHGERNPNTSGNPRWRASGQSSSIIQTEKDIDITKSEASW